MTSSLGSAQASFVADAAWVELDSGHCNKMSGVAVALHVDTGVVALDVVACVAEHIGAASFAEVQDHTSSFLVAEIDLAFEACVVEASAVDADFVPGKGEGEAF